MLTTTACPEEGCVVLKKLRAPLTVKYEPAGKWFETYCLRRKQRETLSTGSNGLLSESSSEESLAETDLTPEDEDDLDYLHSLNPKEWKDQDHYAVLGLKNRRYQATDDEIKRSYKKKVLKHHPDKRRHAGLAVKDEENDYFTCITRAFEVLGGSAKRKSYDSVDPKFDDDVPDSFDKGDDFYETFVDVFARNSRWSTVQPVPQLGKDDCSIDEVNRFYGFWFEFDSWREFSYLDEEEKEKGENREERRWIELQNKSQRKEKKKEEMTRIRRFVELAHENDPRIKKYREDEKRRKEAEKEARKAEKKAKYEEEERKRKEAEEEARKLREKEEEEKRAKVEAEKKEKEAHKKALKKEKAKLRTLAKDNNYYADDEARKLNNMTELERLLETLDLNDMKKLNEDLAKNKDGAGVFNAKLLEVDERLEKEKLDGLTAAQRAASAASATASTDSVKAWTDEETQLLIKGVNMFPAGTANRWEVVASFIVQHASNSPLRTAKEVLQKAKALQKMDSSTLKEEANKNAFQTFASGASARGNESKKAPEDKKMENQAATQRFEVTGDNPNPWSTEEQQLLEQALKTYPAALGAERWEKISECVPSRSKKECMKRYKELAEMVKAKKTAMAAAAAAKK